MSYISRILFIILLIIIGVLPLYSAGTVDVLSWQAWIAAIEKDGLIAGFNNSELIYPPLTWVILQGVAIAYHILNIEMFLALKWALVVFLLLTSAIFLLWTRNLLLTAVLHLSLVLNSVSLGYLDIWMAPTLLLAFWALKERKIFLFSVFFTTSFLIKWQPLIIGPFLLAYIVGQTGITNWKATLKVLLRDVILPVGVLIGMIVFPFGQAVLGAFQSGMSHTGLTGNALNYNWLVTYYLRLTQPDRFGAIDGVGGIVDYSAVTEWSAADWPIAVVPRVLFAFFYLTALLVFLRRSKSFENLLRFTIVGYFAYFTFNIGVHENHLFLAAFLAFILCWVNSRDLYTTLTLALVANINIFLFYGMTGGYPYNRQIGMDVSVPLALFNVVFFLAFWAKACWYDNLDAKANSKNQHSPERQDSLMTEGSA